MIAYKGDDVSAREELKLIDETRCSKKCDGMKLSARSPAPTEGYARILFLKCAGFLLRSRRKIVQTRARLVTTVVL